MAATQGGAVLGKSALYRALVYVEAFSDLGCGDAPARRGALLRGPFPGVNPVRRMRVLCRRSVLMTVFRSISKQAKGSIAWLCHRAPLPENLLLSLPESTTNRIFAAESGQRRINELLRTVQGRLIGRNAAMTVARQEDGMKWCRDARPQLARDGIVVLGHQNDSHPIARDLELPLPAKGEHVAARLVPVAAMTSDRPVAHIDGGYWAVARAGELAYPAPRIKY